MFLTSRRPRWLFTAVFLLAILFVSNSFLAFDQGAATGEEGPGFVTADSAARGDLPYIKRSSSAIAVTSDGQTLLVVNPDSNSLSLIDLGEPSAVTEIDVGADPRTVAVSDDNRRAYTANRAGQSVSVIDGCPLGNRRNTYGRTALRRSC